MAADRGPVGVGGSQPRYIADETGENWIMKGTFLGGQDHAYLRLNEGLCALLGRRLGIPIPQAAVVELTIDQLHGFKPGAAVSEGVAFASHEIDPREAISPQSASACSSDQLAAIVVFDAFVRNTDQKPEHILVQESDGQWQPWTVDFGHTLATAHTLAGNFGATNACSPPLELLRSNVSTADLKPWVSAVETVGAAEVQRMILSLPGEWIIEPDTPEKLASIVAERVHHVRALLQPHFPGLD